MGGVEGIIVHGSGHLDDGCGVTGDIVDHFLRGNRDVARVLLRVDDVAHRVGGGFRLGGVDEGELVAGEGQRQLLAAFGGTVAGHGDGLLEDDLAHGQVRVGDDLVGGHGVPILIHVVHGVGQRGAGPLGVHDGIGGNLGGPVEEIAALGVPAVEDVTLLGGVGLGLGGPTVLLDGLGVGQLGGGAVTVHEGDFVAGGRPLGVERHIAGGHLVEGVGGGQVRIGVPSAEGVV